MIAKCKAIAHGGNALEYIFHEGKFGRLLALHNLCDETPKEIHEEMKLINDYNSRLLAGTDIGQTCSSSRQRRTSWIGS